MPKRSGCSVRSYMIFYTPLYARTLYTHIILWCLLSMLPVFDKINRIVSNYLRILLCLCCLLRWQEVAHKFTALRSLHPDLPTIEPRRSFHVCHYSFVFTFCWSDHKYVRYRISKKSTKYDCDVDAALGCHCLWPSMTSRLQWRVGAFVNAY